MSGFSRWRAPRRDPEASPLHAVAPDLARRLPGRRTSSILDRMRDDARSASGSHRGTTSTMMNFSDVMPGRVDAPFYTGIQGRAAICLQLSPEWATTLDELRPLVEEGATLHAMAWTEGYPLLRAVIEFPRRMDLYFESLLELTDGNLQEFVVDAVVTGTVELHVTVAGDTRALALGCRAPRIREVLGGVVETLCRENHPREPGLVHAASDLARTAYPAVSDGLSGATAIALEPVGQVSSVAKLDLQF